MKMQGRRLPVICLRGYRLSSFVSSQRPPPSTLLGDIVLPHLFDEVLVNELSDVLDMLLQPQRVHGVFHSIGDTVLASSLSHNDVFESPKGLQAGLALLFCNYASS